jgi:hypothetical protein
MMTQVDEGSCALEASTRRKIDTGSQFVRQITRLEVVSVMLLACTALLFVFGSSSGTTQLSKSKPYFNLNQSKGGEFKFKYTTGRRHDAHVNQLMATECNSA